MLWLLHSAGIQRSTQVMLAWRTRELHVTWIHSCRHCSSQISYERQVSDL